MIRLRILLICFITIIGSIASAQVKIRLFSDKSPESAVFSVTKGKYEINAVNGEKLVVIKGEPVIITRYHGRLAVKKREAKGFLCDSVLFEGKTGDDYFSLRLVGNIQVRQYYSGDLMCFPDLGTLVLINISDVEKYVSGVVMAEGGS